MYLSVSCTDGSHNNFRKIPEKLASKSTWTTYAHAVRYISFQGWCSKLVLFNITWHTVQKVYAKIAKLIHYQHCAVRQPSSTTKTDQKRAWLSCLDRQARPLGKITYTLAGTIPYIQHGYVIHNTAFAQFATKSMRILTNYSSFHEIKHTFTTKNQSFTEWQTLKSLSYTADTSDKKSSSHRMTRLTYSKFISVADPLWYQTLSKKAVSWSKTRLKHKANKMNNHTIKA